MRSAMHRVPLTLAVVGAVVGCGRAQPKHPTVEPGQIRVVQSDGETWYEHVDGPHFRGERGKGLIEAVEGHAPAERLAVQSRQLRVAGAVLRMVAGAAVAGGFLAWATTRHLDNQTNANVAVFSLVGAGVALGITGGVLGAVGEKRKWRAIDSFNAWVVKDGSGFRKIPKGPGDTVEDAEPEREPAPDDGAAGAPDEGEDAGPDVAALSLHPRGVN